MYKLIIFIFPLIAFSQGLNSLLLRVEKVEAMTKKLQKDIESLPKSSTVKDTSSNTDYEQLRKSMNDFELDLQLVKTEVKAIDVSQIEALNENIKLLNSKVLELESNLNKKPIEEKPKPLELKQNFKIAANINSDVWADDKGNYYNNELTRVIFDNPLTEKISVDFALEFVLGRIPEGSGDVDDRWVTPNYWGIWVDWKQAFD